MYNKEIIFKLPNWFLVPTYKGLALLSIKVSVNLHLTLALTYKELALLSRKVS